jgi:arylsulfatase A-like enzyme
VETAESARLLLPLSLACGVAAGALALGLDKHLAHPCSRSLLVAVAGWLVVGPDFYHRFDHVDVWRRIVAASTVTAGFAVLGLALVVSTRRSRAGVLEVWLASLTNVLLFVAGLAPGPVIEKAGPSVVLVLIDTLRADAPDRTTAAGAIALMPRFQEIAGAGVRYTQAVAPSPWTLPSAMSLLSAMNPYRHETGRLRGYVALPGNPRASWLGPALREAGYQPAAFLNNPWLRPYYGFGRGFLTWRRYRGTAREGVDAALDWVAVHRHRPFFLMLHLMDPHWPYRAPEGYGESRRRCETCDDLPTLQYKVTEPEVHEEVRRRYDAETVFTDHELGRLWDGLRSRGDLDRSWLIVVSDHGEEFWDHGRFLHGHTLYDELLRVPLLVVAPLALADAPRGVRVGEQVRLEDVGATIADLARSVLPEKIDGHSLLADQRVWGSLAGLSSAPVLAPGDAAVERPEVAGFLQQEGWHDWAVRTRGMKLMRTGEAPSALLFDLAADPQETKDVSSTRPLAAWELSLVPTELGFAVERSALRTSPLPASTSGGGLLRELRALGYAH